MSVLDGIDYGEVKDVLHQTVQLEDLNETNRIHVLQLRTIALQASISIFVSRPSYLPAH